jgi:uncharacterized protein (TIGR00251 family)
MADELFDIVDEDPAGRADAPTEKTSTIVLRLHVQPGAGRSAVVGRHGDALHVRVAPPPQDGRANVAVQALVADLFDVPKSSVELSAGERSREKRFRIQGVEVDVVRHRIAAALAGAKTRGADRGESGGKVRQPH